MSLFAKAKAKAQESAQPSKKKGTPWVVGGSEADAQVAKAVGELVRLNAESKAIDAKMELHKTVVKKFSLDRFCNDFAAAGIMPDTPMYVQNPDGQKVTFVVQDRSSQYKVKAEQLEALKDLLGPGAVEDLTYEETTFSFNRAIMALPGVMEKIGAVLEGAIGELVEEGVLTAEQSTDLLAPETKTAFKPGTLERAAVIVGQSSTRIRQFLDIMGSGATNYVKP
jgi:hypothetical protein